MNRAVRLSGHVASSRVRKDVLRALNEALLAASPNRILRKKVKITGDKLVIENTTLSLNNYERIIVIGGGKAAASMALELEDLLGDKITSGLVNIPDYLKIPTKRGKIEFHRATHPIPSEKGVRGVKAMLKLVGKPSKRDLIICLITGGGSALLPMPIKGLELSDQEITTNLLLKSGAPIQEINCVRKHLSAVKGGRLAEKLYPARILGLIISDVVGDSFDQIASGPTVADPTTFRQAKEIVENYNLWKKLPSRVKNLIVLGLANKSKDTPKPGSKIFLSVSNFLIGTNNQSCHAAVNSLLKSGYKASILSTHVQGEAREIGKLYSAILRDMNGSSPCAFVAGGETTVTITGKAGRGGRNQELVLSTSIGIDGLKGAVIASMGTDGVDGPTDAAGAIADYDTLRRAKEKSLEAITYLRDHSSYAFFRRLDDLIVTGPTGTNVNDICILARSN